MAFEVRGPPNLKKVDGEQTEDTVGGRKKTHTGWRCTKKKGEHGRRRQKDAICE